MNKYNAVKRSLDGYTFDSLAEANRYEQLLLNQKAGDISGLEVHPRIELQPAFVFHGEKVRSIVYVADFKYQDEGYTVYEDVKGGLATQTSEFKLKAKLLKWLFRDDPKTLFVVVER